MRRNQTHLAAHAKHDRRLTGACQAITIERRRGKAAFSAAGTCQGKGLRKNAANSAAGGKDGV